MKKIFLALFLLSTCIVKAQSGNPKMDELIAQMKNQNKAKGTMHLVGKGAVVDEAASIFKTPKGYYHVGSDLMAANSQTQVHIYISKIVSGKQSLFIDKNTKSIAIINGTAYEVNGDINFTIKGKTASATFTGKLYEIQKKSGKASTTPSGPITVTFKNLLLP